MEDQATLIESLLEKATDYGKTSYELVKLKTLEKTSDVVSSVIPNAIVFILISSFMLFLNLGLGFWLGEILGKTFYGFLIIAAFYGLIGLILHFFMHNWLKNIIYNSFIKLMLKSKHNA